MATKSLRRWLVFLLCLYLLGTVVGAVVLAEIALHPGRRSMSVAQAERARGLLLESGADVQEAQIAAADGAVLRGWFVAAQRRNGSAVVLLHGVSDSRLGMYGYAQPLLAAGFDVLLPDARAHGDSGGAIATYGALERDDIARWANWLRSQKAERCVDGFGESMGAGQVLQALVGAKFCAVVAESAFSNFREVSYDRVGGYIHFGGAWIGHTLARPMVDLAMVYARYRYGVRLDEANPIDEVRQTQTPVLLVHGLEDTNILPYHSRAMAASNLKSVSLWLVPGARHCGAVDAQHDEFWSRVLREFRGDGASITKFSGAEARNHVLLDISSGAEARNHVLLDISSGAKAPNPVLQHISTGAEAGSGSQ